MANDLKRFTKSLLGTGGALAVAAFLALPGTALAQDHGRGRWGGDSAQSQPQAPANQGRGSWRGDGGGDRAARAQSRQMQREARAQGQAGWNAGGERQGGRQGNGGGQRRAHTQQTPQSSGGTILFRSDIPQQPNRTYSNPQRNRTYADPQRNGTYRQDRNDGQHAGNWRERQSADGWRERQRDEARNRESRQQDTRRSRQESRETWWNGNNTRQRYENDRRNHREWNRDWRRDGRYNWSGYRNSHRDVYRIGRYSSPYRNHYYSRLGIGVYLNSLFYSNRYWIDDPWQYRLPEVYGPYRWIRYYDDALLVDIYTGEVVDVIYEFFW